MPKLLCRSLAELQKAIGGIVTTHVVLLVVSGVMGRHHWGHLWRASH